MYGIPSDSNEKASQGLKLPRIIKVMLILGLAIVVCFILAAVAFFMLIKGNPSSAPLYDYYIPQLHSMSDSDAVTADRNITVKLRNTWSNPEEYDGLENYVTEITDEWTLTNNSAEAVTLSLAYPIFEDADLNISLGGEVIISPNRLAGICVQDYLSDYYSDLVPKKIRSNEYLEFALSEIPMLGNIVTVYQLSNMSTSDEKYSKLAIEFNISVTEHRMLAYDSSGWSIGDDRQLALFSTRGQSGNELVVLLGEYSGGYEIYGYDMAEDNGSTEEKTASASITRYTTTMGELLRTLAREMYESELYPSFEFDQYYHTVCLTFSDWFEKGYPQCIAGRRGFYYEKELLCDLGAPLRDSMNIRVWYYTAEISIPAGESKLLSMSYETRSISKFCFMENGADDIECINFTANIIRENTVEMTDGNVGIDHQKISNSVSLDPNRSDYYFSFEIKATD